MDNNNNTENNEYQFVREKIVSKKKSRVKRVLFFVAGTIVLAVLFGFLARLSFGLSENTVAKILGLSPTPTHAPYKISTDAPSPTSTAVPTWTGIPTPSGTEKPTLTPTPTATPEPTEAPVEPDDKKTSLETLTEMYREMREVAEKASKFIAEIRLVKVETDWFGEPLETASSTSGIILGDNREELLLLTSAENAEAADRLDVIIGGELIKDVSVKASNAEYNLAVLSIGLSKVTEAAKEKIAYASFYVDEKPAPGTPLLAIGSPNGYMGSFELGMVTTAGNYAYVTDNRLEIMNTDIVYRENGSGVFVDFSGRVVGLITHRFRENSSSNMMTMVTISNMHSVIENLANGRAWNYLGVVAKEAPDSILSELDLKCGLYVTEVKEDSPAEKAGIKKGDILTNMGTKLLDTVETLNGCLDNYRAEQKVTVRFARNGKTETVTVEIELTNQVK